MLTATLTIPGLRLPRSPAATLTTDMMNCGGAHHQGDLGTAAYAIVPELIRLMANAAEPDWRAYALVATIEERRMAIGNPATPDWLEQPYEAALREVVQPALAHLRSATGEAEVRSLLAVLAHAKGQRTIGAIALWTEDERREALGEL
jgi:hypothetical protein